MSRMRPGNAFHYPDDNSTSSIMFAATRRGAFVRCAYVFAVIVLCPSTSMIVRKPAP
jgi:hypothetical protein